MKFHKNRTQISTQTAAQRKQERAKTTQSVFAFFSCVECKNLTESL